MPADKPLLVAMVSLGCPKNLVDSEKILAHLAEAGLIVGAPIDEADVIVVNTCGFIAPATAESLEVIAEALEHKRSGRARRVVVAGCLPNRDGPGLYEQAPGIDALVGVNDRDAILAAVTADGRRTMLSPPGGAVLSDAGRFRLTPHHTAYLRISEGCSQKCTFCTIPAIRGPFRSKRPDAVLDEARELVADGCVELNVIGQDTTSYGRDLRGPETPARLLRRLNRLEGLRWLRLLYAYPKRFGDSLIGAIADCERIVPYVDLPLQHISDPVLRRMGRGVTRKTIEKLLGKLIERVGGLVIRTTFIVGFPGEGEQQFAELLDFVTDFRFDAVGVFEFSPEPGTPAASLPAAVPGQIAAERRRALMLAQQKIAFDANSDMIGESLDVLVDGTDAAGRCTGRFYGQAPDIDGLCYLTTPRPAGTFAQGKVVDYDGYDLIVD